MHLQLGYHIKTTPDMICHIRDIENLYMRNCVKEYGIAVQIFAKAPAQFSESILPKRLDLEECRKYCRRHNVYIVIHGIYLTNFCNYKDSARARRSVIEDLTIIERLSPNPGKSGVVIHLGSNNFGGTIDECIFNFCANIEDCLNRAPGRSKILLETSVKSMNGNEIFHDITKLSLLFKNIRSADKKRIGFVIDSCHIFSSGYDIRSHEGVQDFLQLWHKLIGLDHICLFHLNDSKLGLGCCRDLHAEIGTGHIFKDRQDGLQSIISFCKRNDIPIVMETKSDHNREFKFISQFIKNA